MEEGTVPSRKARARLHREAALIERAARKEIKRNRKPDCVRQREWLRVELSDENALEALGGEERVMPRGERERRRSTLAALAKREREEAPPEAPGAPAGEALARGVVVQVASGLCRVELDGSQAPSPEPQPKAERRGSGGAPAAVRSLLCSLRGSLSVHETGYTNVVAVGDEVRVAEDGTRQGVIEEVLPRRSVLARPDPFYPHLRQVVAANVEQLLVVASWREPTLWFELLDRYLIAAARCGLTPLICLNKVDLAEDAAATQAALEPYVVLGYQTVLTSATTGQGIGELRALLWGRMTALAGLSGVGKSTLLAAVQPGLALRTGEVSERRHEGRHTTTQVTLHRLAEGGYVIDTPGIRELGLAGLRRAELVRYYPEVAAAAAGCHYADCSHGREPGCAVRQAAREGRIATVRYDSYRKIAASLPG